jgi:hypothetical protein
MNYLDNNKPNWYNKSMKKSLLIVSVFVILSLMIFNVTQAASSTSGGKKPFGGKITDEEALQISTLEDSGWDCAVPGDTFDIRAYGKSPTGPYLVPAGVSSRSGGAPAPQKWVLGFYNQTQTRITCTRSCPPYTCVTTVGLYPISLFGLSK